MNPKPGIRSTEFALTALAMVGLFVLAVIDPPLRQQTLVALAAVVGVYSASRGLVKARAAAQTPSSADPTPQSGAETVGYPEVGADRLVALEAQVRALTNARSQDTAHGR